MTATRYAAPAEASIFTAAAEAFDETKAWLTSEATTLSESEVERDLAERGREILRRLLAAHVTLRCQQVPSGPVVGDDGARRTHVRPGMRTLMTVFGVIEVVRDGYSGRGLDSRFPVDAALNLPPERPSLEVQRLCAVEAARGSYDEGVDAVRRTTGASVAKRQFEQLAVRAAADFDAFYESTELVADPRETSDILVLTFDGKGVVMRFDGLRAGTQKAARQSQHKLTTRLSKGEKANRKRMAEVAAVYTIAPRLRSPEAVVASTGPVRDATNEPPRPRPENKRVWASLEKPPGDVIAEAFEEAHTRDSQGTKRWVVLVDGNRHQLDVVREQAGRLDVDVTIVVDFIHVLEYLWKAAYVFNKEGSAEAEAWVHARLALILQGKATHVAAGIKQSATKRKLTRARRKNADKCAKYLLGNAESLRYHEYLRDGLPIATGVIEGACRHLIADRMDITGARWSLAGAEAILRLRSIRSSGDFDEYWAFHEQQERARNHETRYADNSPTQLSPAQTRPRLALVR